MPLTHQRTFRVRHYECDAYNRLNYAAYLGYMQEAAFDASAAVGFGPDVLTAMGYYWLVRETEVNYLGAIKYGDTVEVRTWVAHFTRILSYRMYEFRVQGSDVVVARARTDWVFIQNDNGKPVRIPEEMAGAYIPKDREPWEETRPRFPRGFDLPGGGVTLIGERVQYHDLDPGNHVNNSVYLAYIEDANVQALANARWTPERMRGEGFTMNGLRHRIKYRGQAILGDELELATWFVRTDDSGAQRHTVMRRPLDGAVLTESIGDYAWVNDETGKATRPPGAFLEDIQRL